MVHLIAVHCESGNTVKTMNLIAFENGLLERAWPFTRGQRKTLQASRGGNELDVGALDSYERRV
jgi:hypothetical protein